MHKFSFAFALILLLCFVSDSSALNLPDNINEWHCINEYILPIVPDADSKDLGRCVYKNYVRKNSSGELQIILTEGQGTGSLYIPDEKGKYKGVMPSDSEYKILVISGHKSILEIYKHMPLALAVSLSGDIIITIETDSLDEENIVKIAEIILQKTLQIQ